MIAKKDIGGSWVTITSTNTIIDSVSNDDWMFTVGNNGVPNIVIYQGSIDTVELRFFE
jgi:hypothetical protein